MDKDLQTRLIFAGVALAIFLPLVALGGDGKGYSGNVEPNRSNSVDRKSVV